jgi:hypothetical protein
LKLKKTAQSGHPVRKTRFSSFRKSVNFGLQTVYDENEVDLKSPIVNFNEAGIIAPIAVAVVVAVGLGGLAIFCFKRRCRQAPKENKTSQFYVDNVLGEDSVRLPQTRPTSKNSQKCSPI